MTGLKVNSGTQVDLDVTDLNNSKVLQRAELVQVTNGVSSPLDIAHGLTDIGAMQDDVALIKADVASLKAKLDTTLAVKNPVISGIATGGSTTTLVKSTANWAANQHAGAFVKITQAAGGEPYYAQVLSNSATTLNFAAIAITVALNDTFEIYPQFDIGALSKDTDSVAAYLKASAQGGGLSSVYSIMAAATTNVAIVKNGPASLYSITIANVHTSAQLVRLYNAAIVGDINPASTTKLAMRFIIPPNTCREINLPYGYYFDTGIGIAITGGISDTDNTAATANTLAVNIFTA